jgi:hypothetical protein
MTIRERNILLKLHSQVLKLTQNPPTTFSGTSGSVPAPTQYQAVSLPNPLPPLPKYNG